MGTLKPICPPCTRCGKQPRFLTSMLDPKVGRTFHMFQCECGDKSWTPEKKTTRRPAHETPRGNARKSDTVRREGQQGQRPIPGLHTSNACLRMARHGCSMLRAGERGEVSGDTPTSQTV